MPRNDLSVVSHRAHSWCQLFHTVALCVVLGLAFAAALAMHPSSASAVTDADAHVAVGADGKLTAAAQNWLKNYNQSDESTWLGQGPAAQKDVQDFYRLLLRRYLPPAGKVLPLAPGQITQAQVCGYPMPASTCWLYRRDDRTVFHCLNGPPVVPCLTYYETWNRTAFCTVMSCTFPHTAPAEDLFRSGVYYFKKTSTWTFNGQTYSQTCDDLRQPGGTKEYDSNQSFDLGCGHDTFSQQGRIFIRSARDGLVLGVQPKDPNIPVSSWGATYADDWPSTVGALLTKPENQHARDYLGHSLNPIVDNPYHPDTAGASPVEIPGPAADDGPAPNVPVVNCGDPVNCATGNFWERFTDFSIGGRGVGLNLTRTYNAQDAVYASAPGAFGYGWSATFREHLTINSALDEITVHHSNGASAFFHHVDGEGYVAPAWVESQLTKNGSGEYDYLTPDQRVFHFSASGRLLSVADRNGNTATLAYDGAGNLAAVTDPSGRRLTFTYNSDGTVATTTDPAQHTIHYTYSSGKLTSVTDARGSTWGFEYDANRRITKVTDPRGNAVTNVYDAQNRVSSQTDRRGKTTTWTYLTDQTKITDPLGHVTDEHFAKGAPTSITHGYGTAQAATTTIEYDAALRPTRITDQNGKDWRYEYDSDGNRTAVIDPLQHRWTYSYNSRHDVTRATDALGRSVDFDYNTTGNLTRITRTLTETGVQQESTFTRNALGQLTDTTDPLGHAWHLGYNQQGDVTSLTSPGGRKTTATYDANGWLTSKTSPRGNVPGADPAEYTTTYTADAAGNPLTVRDHHGHETIYAYDASGNRTSVTDRDGRTTQVTYDASGRPTQVRLGNGTTLATGYDAVGAIVTQTDGAAHTTTYTRDALGRIIAVEDPLHRATSLGYDAGGRRTTMTDPAGRTTTWSYDPANRLTGVHYSSGTPGDVTMSYDANGHRATMTDDSGHSSYEYDSLGRLTAATTGTGQTTTYGWDLSDQLTRMGYPDALIPAPVGTTPRTTVSAGTISRHYDQDGLLTAVDDWLGHTTAFEYDSDANLTRIVRPNGTTAMRSYDRDGALTDIVDQGAGLGFAFEAHYHRTAEKLLSSIQEGTTTRALSYDNAGRLTASGPTGAPDRSYSYDSAGNGTMFPGTADPVQRIFDDAGQLTAIDGPLGQPITNLTYNSLGERTSVTDVATSLQTTYSYDQAQQLTGYVGPDHSYTGPGAAPTVSQTYLQDGDGLRQQKVTNGVESNEVWELSGTLPLLIEEGADAYIHGPGGLPIEQIRRDGSVRYLHTDGHGSISALTDTNGTEVGRYGYDDYGRTTSTAGENIPFGYDGQLTDPQTGLQYLRARYYDPATGQFLTRDPLESATREAYAYASNDPINRHDPSGLATIERAPVPDEGYTVGPQTPTTILDPVPDRENPGEAYTPSPDLGSHLDFPALDGNGRLGETIEIECGPIGSTQTSDPDPPALDGTGKVHGDIPSHIPDGWTIEQLEELAVDLPRSIATRKQEQIDIGEHGPHRERLRQEDRLLRQVNDRLLERGLGA